jgi:hypothetical protein
MKRQWPVTGGQWPVTRTLHIDAIVVVRNLKLTTGHRPLATGFYDLR